MFEEKIPLSKYSNYKIGGPARYFFEAKNVEEIIKALDKWRRLAPYRIRKANFGSGIFVLAGGTNILFNDEGFDGLILKPNLRFIKKDGNFLKVGAGVLMTQLVNDLMTEGLSNLEWAAGLPGTIGGAIYGNAGAFGSEMKDIVREIVSLDISGSKPKIIKRNNQECAFSYRSSIFKSNKNRPLRGREIIIEATLVLKKGDKKLIQEIIKKILIIGSKIIL
jgi:UDP-N-acetylmuramate dehydrogenase